MELNRLLELAGVPLNEAFDAQWSDIYDSYHRKFMKDITKVMNDEYKGKTIVVKDLNSDEGHSWKEKEITVKDVTWAAHDTNGPVFRATDGKTYNSHPDHKITKVK